jgi:hypothetical protein
LVTIGETIVDSELVRIEIEGFMKQWEPLIKGIMAREKLLD